ncbi:MAG: glycosyl hydrolase family 18 protein [Bacillota bacterium]
MVRRLRLLLCVFTMLAVFTQSFPVMAVAAGGDLGVGSSGSRVVELQNLLKREGFFPATQKSTGYFGWITYGAVTALEKKYGLPVDGRVGSREWGILYGIKNPGKTVLGFYAVDYPGDVRSYDSYSKNSQLVNQVAMFDYTIDAWGNLKGSPSNDGIWLAKSKGDQSVMVVHNISGYIDLWSANSVITNQSYRKNLRDNILKKMWQYGYDGVNIDLEGISANARKDFNTFLEELSGSLRANNKLLTVAVPAKTSDYGSSWNEAYDYATIGRLADLVMVMSYDEHWPGGPAGPVASLPWVTEVLDYSTSAIPAGKILLGVACYGYDWPDGQTASAVRWKDMPGLIATYGAGNVWWDDISSSPCLTYWKNGVRHQVWFENKYSLAIKLGLVKSYGLGGIGFWRLGYEDNSFWETVSKNL